MLRANSNQVFVCTVMMGIFSGCSETAEEGDAGVDLGASQTLDIGAPLADVGGDLGTDASVEDAGAMDSGIRRLVEHHLIPDGEIGNLVIHPDFESRLINGGWIAYSLSVIQPQVPLLQRLIRPNTPSSRPEVAVVPGSDVVPTGLGSFAYATEQSFRTSVWLGLDELAASESFDLLSAYILAFEKDQGAVQVTLEAQPASERVIEGVRWRRYETLAMGTFIGRMTLAYENNSPGPMYINAPRVFAVSGFVHGGRSTFERQSGPSMLQRALHRKTVSPSCLGLPDGVCGSLGAAVK